MSNRQVGALLAREPGNTMFKKPTPNPADRRDALRPGAEGPFENGGRALLASPHGDSQALRRPVVVEGQAALLTNSLAGQLLRQRAFPRARQRRGVMALSLLFELGGMTDGACARSGEAIGCSQTRKQQQEGVHRGGHHRNNSIPSHLWNLDI